MSIKGGFYIKARCIRESAVAHCAPAVREIWDYLLREANHEAKKVRDTIIERGQLIRSLSDIRDALSWQVGYRKERYSEDVTKKAMKTLRDLSMISTTKALHGVIVTICKYDYYQDISNYEGTNESTSEGTTNAPSTHQSGTTKQELKEVYKKEKYKKEKSLFEPSSDPEPLEAVFEKIWEGWPQKVSKKKSLETFKKIMSAKNAPTLEVILAGEERYRKYLADHPTIQCAHLSTWLNGQRWEDQYGFTVKLAKSFQSPKEQPFQYKKLTVDDFK